MKKQIPLDAWTDFKEGDQVRSIAPGYGTITVEREVSDPYEPGTMLEFTDGTKAFKVLEGYQGLRMDDEVWLLLFEDGSKGYYTYEYIQEKFTVKEPEVDKPQITRDQFIETLRRTADDNGLEFNRESLSRLMVFAADRLGLY